MAGDGVKHQGTVGNVFGYGANLVKRAGKSYQPKTAHSTVGRLQTDHAAESGGLAYAAAGIGAKCIDSLIGSYGSGRATAAAAGDTEIGRASCRGRVAILVGAVS